MWDLHAAAQGSERHDVAVEPRLDRCYVRLSPDVSLPGLRHPAQVVGDQQRHDQHRRPDPASIICQPDQLD